MTAPNGGRSQLVLNVVLSGIATSLIGFLIWLALAVVDSRLTLTVLKTNQDAVLEWRRAVELRLQSLEVRQGDYVQTMGTRR